MKSFNQVIQCIVPVEGSMIWISVYSLENTTIHYTITGSKKILDQSSDPLPPPCVSSTSRLQRITLKHNCCRNVSQPRSAESQNVNIVQHLPPRTISCLSSKTTYQLSLSFSEQNILTETRAVPWSICKLGLN